MITWFVRAVLSELNKWRLIEVPGNPNGRVWMLDRKGAGAEFRQPEGK